MQHDRPQSRVPIMLACTDCNSRNYRTTKKRDGEVVELKKFCKTCKRHTLHRESK